MNKRPSDNLRQAALDCHEFPKPGKLEICTTKPLANGRDLARACSPGVAKACLEIKADLDGSVFRPVMIMRPVFDAARSSQRRIIIAERKDERVLRDANASGNKAHIVAPSIMGRGLFNILALAGTPVQHYE